MADNKPTNDAASNKAESMQGASGTHAATGVTPSARNLPNENRGEKGEQGGAAHAQNQSAVQSEVQTGELRQGARNLADSAADAARGARQAAVTVATDAQDKLKEVAGEAQSTLTTVVEQAKQDANTVVDEQKKMVVERLRTVSNSLRQTGSRLQNDDEATIGSYAQDAAGQIDRFVGYLQDHDTGDLINEVRNIAHRQPEIFIAGSLAAGFLLGRFLKSSDAFPGGGQSAYGRDTRRYAGDRSPRSMGQRDQGGAVRGGYRNDPTYAELQYRDAMRGDERIREEFGGADRARNQGRGVSDGSGDRNVHEGATGSSVRSTDPAREADRTADRSTTGPGFSPADYGNTAYRGSATQSTSGAAHAATQEHTAEDKSRQDSAARGAQAA